MLLGLTSPWPSGLLIGGLRMASPRAWRLIVRPFGHFVFCHKRLTRTDTYLNYPVSKSLTFTYPNGTVYTPSLVEDVLEQDETTSYPNRVPTFHGYSFSGSASGELVYVGRGQKADFDRLVALGVDLKGKIALARYGGPFRGLKVKNSQQYGMLGTLIYTDIADDGNITESKGYAAYPDGPARNPSSVQKGSVQFLSQYPGDPTTPGVSTSSGQLTFSSIKPINIKYYSTPPKKTHLAPEPNK